MGKRTSIRGLVPALLLAVAVLAGSSPASAQISVGISVHVAPPALPVYVQPVCPTEGYMWTPGYWGYNAEGGYYWVPGVWVAPPRVGVLWTPGYWGFAGGVYGFHAGYWGPHIGFYGGVNYGFGYGGVGFGGGEWRGGHFAYNSAVTNVNTTVVHNTYVNKTVINNTTVNNRASFNGGAGGTTATATAQERVAASEPHTQPTAEQTSHEHNASTDKSNFASENHGKPANPAMSKVGERANNQQARIANGVKSGQMTAGETAHVEKNEQHINQQVHADRQANGGKLTSAEKKQVNHEQNKTSKEIHHDKTNDKTQHPK
jgi:WXXGXW repeat (2 copies)